MSGKDDYASAYWGGMTKFLEWKDKYEEEVSRDEMEGAARKFIGIFKQMFPQELEQMIRSDPDIKEAVRMFGKEM